MDSIFPAGQLDQLLGEKSRAEQERLLSKGIAVYYQSGDVKLPAGQLIKECPDGSKYIVDVVTDRVISKYA